MPGREAQVVFVQQQQQPEIENRNVLEMLTRVGGGDWGVAGWDHQSYRNHLSWSAIIIIISQTETGTAKTTQTGQINTKIFQTNKYHSEVGFVITVGFQPYKALQIQGLSTSRGESEGSWWYV